MIEDLHKGKGKSENVQLSWGCAPIRGGAGSGVLASRHLGSFYWSVLPLIWKCLHVKAMGHLQTSGKFKHVCVHDTCNIHWGPINFRHLGIFAVILLGSPLWWIAFLCNPGSILHSSSYFFTQLCSLEGYPIGIALTASLTLLYSSWICPMGSMQERWEGMMRMRSEYLISCLWYGCQLAAPLDIRSQSCEALIVHPCSLSPSSTPRSGFWQLTFCLLCQAWTQ